MIAIIFEVWPAEGQRDTYLDLAARLRVDLEKMDGFISVERFESLTNPGKMLSLSIWRDEESVKAWRNLTSHRKTQATGRAGVFRDYRLRVAAVVRDYGMFERDEAPDDSRALHKSKAAAADPAF
ncbi:antibiotic biosynthesis monooxygenase family protein [Xanthobacter flavus]|uniref:antibiotic biosynthesis monooxygenase family protein n=1 Tax=Xanthobacter flavus TaxID=281 RepID=UPI0037280CC9